MVGNPLNFVEIVPLISDPPVLNEQLVNVFPMAVTTLLQNLRVGMLEFLILNPLFSLRSHNSFKQTPSQGYTGVEVLGQVVKRLGTGVLNPFDHVKGFCLHDFELGSQVFQVPFRTVSLMKMVKKQLVQDNLKPTYPNSFPLQHRPKTIVHDRGVPDSTSRGIVRPFHLVKVGNPSQ